MDKIRKFASSNMFIFIVFSILWAVILSFAIMVCDDTGAMRVEGGSILSYWAKSMDHYHNWSSRVLVNFIIFIFTDRMPVYWAIFMGVSMFILLLACSKLFIDDSRREECLFLLSMIMLFPYWEINTAGWMATMGTYFAPTAFGMMALIPIKKITLGENLKFVEFLWYSICLIYGANNEQMMILLLGCYGIANIYWWFNKKFSIMGAIQLLIAIASAGFVATCPGNLVRRRVEIVDRFPAFDHLNLLGKVELGYETGIYELLFEKNLFFIVFCLILAVLVWNKYEDNIIRGLAVIPASLSVILGPAKFIVESVLPYISGVSNGIPYWGLVNEENRGGLGYFIQFFLLSICIVIILLNIYLLCENWTQLIVCFTILCMGIASRVAIGFSPTIYISGIRTNTVMYYSFIFVICYIYSVCLKKNENEKRKSFVLLSKGINMLACLAVLNMIFVVANCFRE